jgi:hypothetical protein
MIRIPLPDVAPGAHTVAWGSVGQSVPFEAVALDGAVAQDQLLVGNSTVLDFHLRGTRAQLPILISLTEGGVAIQGGNTQIAFFDGGPRNQVQRTVLAESVGEFGIDYVLDLPPCPCGGWGERLLDDTELAVHSLVARGRADAISLAGDLRLPLSFASDSIVTRTPRPPFSPGDRLDIQFAQLGLRATAPGYGDILFEQRADMPSIANLSGVVPASGGGLEAGDAELSLHTQFSMPLGADNPFEVGGSYEFRLDGFELEGTSPGLGGLSFRQAPGAPGSIRFSDVAADAAGATLYGNADLTVRGRLALGIRTSF